MRTHTSNGQLARSSTSSPPLPGMPHALCSSADDQPKIASFSVDLNEGRPQNSFHFLRLGMCIVSMLITVVELIIELISNS